MSVKNTRLRERRRKSDICRTMALIAAERTQGAQDAVGVEQMLRAGVPHSKATIYAAHGVSPMIAARWEARHHE